MKRRNFLQEAARAVLSMGWLDPLGSAEDAAPGVTPFRTLRHRYVLRMLRLRPVAATHLGGDGLPDVAPGLAGRLRDCTPSALDDECGFLRGVQRELTALDPATLEPADRVDHGLMVSQVAFALRSIEELYAHERALDSYVAEPFRGVEELVRRGSASTRDGGDGATSICARLEAIPTFLRTARQNLLAGRAAGRRPDRRMVLEDGIAGSLANAAYFGRALPDATRGIAVATGADEAATARLERAAMRAAAAFEGFAAFLGRTFEPEADDTDRFALGEAEYEWRLRNNLAEREASTAELWERSAADVARRETLVREADARSGGGPDAPASSITGQALLDACHDTVLRAVRHDREHGFFGVPEDYALDIVPTPAPLQRDIELAGDPAPPLRGAGWGAGVGRLLISTTGEDAATPESWSRAGLVAAVVREGFPGREWFYRRMAGPGLVSPVRWLLPGGVACSTSAWADALASATWTCLSRTRLSEPRNGEPFGFYSLPEYRATLRDQAIEAVLAHVDIGVHTGRMSYDEAVEYVVAGTNAPLARARRAVYRCSKWPTRAVARWLGARALEMLREEQDEGLDRATREAALRDSLLAMGPVPVGFYRDEIRATSTPAGPAG